MSAEAVKPSKAAVFRARLTSTLVLWAIVTSVFVSQNAWAFFGLVAFLTIAGSLEFFGLFRKFPHAGCRVIGIGIGWGGAKLLRDRCPGWRTDDRIALHNLERRQGWAGRGRVKEELRPQ